jgi:hypothetical protein
VAEPPEAVVAAAECVVGLVDLGAAVVADEQPFELVQPGEGALDDPAVAAEAGAVRLVAVGDLDGDAALAELGAARAGVVGAVGEQPVRLAARRAGPATDRGDPVEQRDELARVVAVAAGQRPGEGNAGAIDQKVMLGAISGSVNRARARFGAPFFACTWLESATARDH